MFSCALYTWESARHWGRERQLRNQAGGSSSSWGHREALRGVTVKLRQDRCCWTFSYNSCQPAGAEQPVWVLPASQLRFTSSFVLHSLPPSLPLVDPLAVDFPRALNSVGQTSTQQNKLFTFTTVLCRDVALNRAGRHCCFHWPRQQLKVFILHSS